MYYKTYTFYKYVPNNLHIQSYDIVLHGDSCWKIFIIWNYIGMVLDAQITFNIVYLKISIDNHNKKWEGKEQLFPSSPTWNFLSNEREKYRARLTGPWFEPVSFAFRATARTTELLGPRHTDSLFSFILSNDATYH